MSDFLTPQARRDFLLRVADLYNVPPHLIDSSFPPQPRTWRLRRCLRIIYRKLRP